MSASPRKPEQDDIIRTATASGRIVRAAAACAREKEIPPNEKEPLSLSFLAICGLVAVIAGGILGAAGKGCFDYSATFQKGYVRTPPPGAADQGPKPKEALAAYMAKGEKIYQSKCIGCHGPDAKGDGANYPSLSGSAWAKGETERFSMIVLNGLQGPTSTGKAFASGMPPQGIGLAPEELAGVMTYVRNHFGNSVGDVVSVEMAKEAMKISAARSKAGQQVTGDELTAEHLKALPGEPLDPKAMVDPLTLAPAPGVTAEKRP